MISFCFMMIFSSVTIHLLFCSLSGARVRSGIQMCRVSKIPVLPESFFFLFVVVHKMRRRVFINFTREIVIITRSIVFIFSELIVFLFLNMRI